jgi:hypothetical protein
LGWYLAGIECISNFIEKSRGGLKRSLATCAGSLEKWVLRPHVTSLDHRLSRFESVVLIPGTCFDIKDGIALAGTVAPQRGARTGQLYYLMVITNGELTTAARETAIC